MKCKKPFKKHGIEFGCGQCMPCRIDRARLWKSRLLIEQRLHSASCFATLTYSDEFLPPGGTLVRRDITLFLKRLRRSIEPYRLRYFGVGEYGDKTGRPHYHIILYGVSQLEHALVLAAWTDPEKKKPIGHVHVDELNPTTAGYVCQYVCKKWTNKEDLYVQAQLKGRHPEFPFMSKKPGIGAGAAPIIADAIANKRVDIPSVLRIDGKLSPLGRYLKRKIRENFWNAEEIAEYEKTVWLREVHEENVRTKEEAQKAGKTPEEYRWEQRRQRYLNCVSRASIFKARRTF